MNMTSSKISPTTAFRVFVCAEVKCEKVNLELTFPTTPSLHTLFLRIASAFSEVKRAAQGPAESPSGPFYIGQVVVLASSRDAWLPLVTDAQIEPNCQLYVFQPAGTPDVAETIRGLPPPVPEPYHQLHSMLLLPLFDPMPELTSKRAPRVVPVRTDGATASDLLFDLLDANRDGIVTLYELRDAMQRCGLDTTPRTVGRSFTLGNHPLQRAQLARFYDTYPKQAATLHSRLLAVKAPNGTDLAQPVPSDRSPLGPPVPSIPAPVAHASPPVRRPSSRPLPAAVVPRSSSPAARSLPPRLSGTAHAPAAMGRGPTQARPQGGFEAESEAARRLAAQGSASQPRATQTSSPLRPAVLMSPAIAARGRGSPLCGSPGVHQRETEQQLHRGMAQQQLSMGSLA
jgi:hypothetical protein